MAPVHLVYSTPDDEVYLAVNKLLTYSNKTDYLIDWVNSILFCYLLWISLIVGKTADQAKAELEKQGLQGEALKKILPHKVFQGNRPTNSIVVKKLTPFTLGVLIGKFLEKVKV